MKLLKDEKGGATMDGDIVNYVLGLGVGVVSFFTKRTMGELDSLKDEHKQCQLDLSEFKTEVAKEYTPRSSVVAMFTAVQGDIRELQNDIKTLIARK